MGYAKLFSPDFITKDRSARKKNACGEKENTENEISEVFYLF